MDLIFDIRGNLKPYERVSTSLEDFEDLFVNTFEENSTRWKLFDYYNHYTKDFVDRITGNFTQWINGSFVTNKQNPNDIDLVMLIDLHIVEEKESLIRNEFLGEAVYQKYGIDVYLVILYPENHKLHYWTRSDLLYWNDWFTKGKMDKRKQRHPKGYLEIKFGN